MSMMSIGVTGLNAAQLGLLTTEHNIANVNTEGYNRQRTIQENNIPMGTGSGFLGQGSSVQTVQRYYNQFIAGQVLQSATKVGELDAYYDEVKLIDNMLADPNSGLSPAMQDFFRGLQQVAADPSSLPARQAMVSSTESLVGRFHSIEQRLSQQYAGVNEQLESRVGQVNSLSEQIAQINQRIVASQASTGHPANDLLDQRDTLVAELNKEFRVQTVTQSDGSLAVFAGNGQQLVIGSQANLLRAQPSVSDPERFVIAIASGPTFQELPESALGGGAVGGLLRFRSETLDSTTNALGRIASSVALTFNAQHALGQDLLGNNEGGANFIADYFQISSPKVVPNVLNTGAATLSADFINPPPVRYNNGDFSLTYNPATGYEVVSQKYNINPGDIPPQPTLALALQAADAWPGAPAIDPGSANFFTDLSGSDYRVVVNGADYTVTRVSDNVAVVPSGTFGADTRFDGLTINLSGGAAGDTFLLQANRETARNLQLNSAIAADPRLIAAGMPVRSAVGTTNTGSGKLEVTAVAPGYVPLSSGAPIQIDFANGFITITGTTLGADITVTSNGATAAQSSGVPFAYTPDAVITVDGLSFTLSGQPKTNDTFTILRNTNGISDSRNALLLGKLQSQETISGGTTSFQGAYSQLVSGVGNKTREIQVTGDAQRSLLEQAEGALAAASGVNLDEEAANLIRFQQAYQAAARVIDVGSRLFDVLLGIGN